MKAIEACNLNFSYDKNKKNKIISDLSFEIDKGDFVCITGSNGAGKSTLLKLILNILKPDSGTVCINKKSADEISYVAQNSTHFNRYFPATVKERVNLGLKSFNIFRNNDKKISDVLQKVGMSDFSNKKIGDLSGGQKQRVILAKALINNPKYIFLDEPTTGVDSHAVHSICCLLGDINKKFGITIVMITHDISSIVNHATKIINFDRHIKIISARNFDFGMFFHKNF